MESSSLTNIFLPLALFIIMLGMGLGLTVADFKRILVEPKAVILGLIAQLVLLPFVGFVLISFFSPEPQIAVGIMILAACPGGPTSNLISYLAKGNVALSITLTAISSLITVFTIPLVVNLAMQTFLGADAALRLPLLETIGQIAVITLIPVSLGMVLHNKAPRFAARVETWVKWLSLFFLGLIIAGLLVKERANVVDFFAQVGGITFALMAISMSLGYGIAKLAELDNPSATSITIEVGVQNGTLAIAIASGATFLNNPTMAIPAAIYALLMFVVSGVFAWWAQKQPVTFDVANNN
ncbi:bile acid:sodium symporter family protein [Leptothoe kymatousa]|uniref:Bile acid:sodium symporter family protein n=1 Tax=Leptothoe kymatousa TAU-MAC 1615 TaxID=2364775 RepID=A0ABS5XY83_9CYAN|nr:bile acid:sodium symporter family protein [Leptothoe kymatousa]MBT9310612.1 bile acid:sodium symporter family protein [Leptothoe kymatousa TAU-MAC 1615]